MPRPYEDVRKELAEIIRHRNIPLVQFLRLVIRAYSSVEISSDLEKLLMEDLRTLVKKWS